MQRIVLIAIFIAFTHATGLVFGQGQSLADQIMDADEEQFSIIFPKLKEQAEQEIPVLVSEIERKLSPNANQVDKEKLAKRQANAAVVLLKLNQADKVWSVFKHSPDPRARSYLIHRMGPLGVDPKVIINRLDVEPDVSIRRALILSLGEFDLSAIPLDGRSALLPKFQEMYRADSDPGLHAASEWLLRKWEDEVWLKQINEKWANDKEVGEKRLGRLENRSPQWYVNGQGQTIVVIPGPVQFMMGSPAAKEDRPDIKPQHKRHIGRTFCISSKLVTFAQFRRFDNSYSTSTEAYSHTSDLPAVEVSWFQAVEYCNWLSKEEGIPEDQWCYELNEKETKLKEKHLSLAGYRLPTEAETEYATRAGATTARFYGESIELLAKYAWYDLGLDLQPRPVGLLKPNDLGLFDMHGNVAAWCLERFKANTVKRNEEVSDDQDDDLTVRIGVMRSLRGGSNYNRASNVHSVSRALLNPTFRNPNCGFRLARTIPSDSTTPSSKTSKESDAEQKGK